MNDTAPLQQPFAATEDALRVIEIPEPGDDGAVRRVRHVHANPAFARPSDGPDVEGPTSGGARCRHGR